MGLSRLKFIRVIVAGFMGLAVGAIALAVPHIANAATAANSQSPLGMNLMNVNYYDPEQPFLNIFKTTGVSKTTIGWYTRNTMSGDTKEESYLQLDSNGYPTTLTSTHQPQKFTEVEVLLLRNLPNSNMGTGLPYRAGKYVVLYDGEGKLGYSGEASLVSSAPGRDVVNVASPGSEGIMLMITQTDPNHTGNYIHNIRVVYATEESLLAAGNVFRPGFLSLLQKFHAIRFMQWLEIDNDGGNLSSWASRPQLTDGGWGGANGVPVEVALELCNATGADCWLNVPHQATDDYITQMATVAHTMLGKSQKIYIEFSNEVWNGAYPQFAYAEAQGKALWPNADVTAFTLNRNWYGMRTAQTCDIWKSVWGSDYSRVHCVLGAQVAQTATAVLSLQCSLWTGGGNAPCSSHNITDVGISVYLGLFTGPTSWLSALDGGLNTVFQQINEGNVLSSAGASQQENSQWEASYHSALAPYKLGMLAYEGGQSLVSIDGSLVPLYTKANRDPRMAAAYTTMLNNWKANGGGLFAVFADIYSPSNFGEWGALESFLDPVTPLSSAPPKWQALQNFISGNNCWWASCAGAIGSTQTATPMAPSNLAVK
jgi:hypothetical protein